MDTVAERQKIADRILANASPGGLTEEGRRHLASGEYAKSHPWQCNQAKIELKGQSISELPIHNPEWDRVKADLLKVAKENPEAMAEIWNGVATIGEGESLEVYPSLGDALKAQGIEHHYHNGFLITTEYDSPMPPGHYAGLLVAMRKRAEERREGA